MKTDTFILLAVLALATARGPASASGDCDQAGSAQRFSSGTEVVRIDVLVADRNRPVRGLGAGNFELRDAGVIQHVQQLDVETLPLDVICAFDTSGSIDAILKQLVESGLALLDALEAQDRVAVLAFANRVSVVAPLTTDRGVTAAAIHRLSAGGRTVLRDGAFAGIALQEPGQRRTLLLIFSDGQDTGSWLRPGRVIEAAGRADVVVYGVALGRPKQSPPETAFLEALAKETGGRVIVTDGSADIRLAFTRIIAEFRDRYVLSYEPAPAGVKGWHPIQVTLKGRSGKVSARRGYFAD